MRKKFFYAAFAVAILASGFWGYRSFNEKGKRSDLFCENVEALAQTETVLKCSRMIASETCYGWIIINGEKKWGPVGERISAVEEYTIVVPSAFICLHDKITYCR